GQTMSVKLTWPAGYLYALAFGGYVALSVYLPTFLNISYDLEPTDASLRMACFVIVAVATLPIGFFLTDLLGTIPNLCVVYSITGFVGAAGGLGGFVPPILLGAMWSATQDYSLGLLLLAGFTVIALLITLWIGTTPPAPEAAAAGDTASRPRDTADEGGPTQPQTSDDDKETRS